jgi:hypothetical protein
MKGAEEEEEGAIMNFGPDNGPGGILSQRDALATAEDG